MACCCGPDGGRNGEIDFEDQEVDKKVVSTLDAQQFSSTKDRCAALEKRLTEWGERIDLIMKAKNPVNHSLANNLSNTWLAAGYWEGAMGKKDQPKDMADISRWQKHADVTVPDRMKVFRKTQGDLLADRKKLFEEITRVEAQQVPLADQADEKCQQEMQYTRMHEKLEKERLETWQVYEQVMTNFQEMLTRILSKNKAHRVYELSGRYEKLPDRLKQVTKTVQKLQKMNNQDSQLKDNNQALSKKVKDTNPGYHEWHKHANVEVPNTVNELETSIASLDAEYNKLRQEMAQLTKKEEIGTTNQRFAKWDGGLLEISSRIDMEVEKAHQLYLQAMENNEQMRNALGLQPSTSLDKDRQKLLLAQGIREATQMQADLAEWETNVQEVHETNSRNVDRLSPLAEHATAEHWSNQNASLKTATATATTQIRQLKLETAEAVKALEAAEKDQSASTPAELMNQQDSIVKLRQDIEDGRKKARGWFKDAVNTHEQMLLASLKYPATSDVGRQTDGLKQAFEALSSSSADDVLFQNHTGDSDKEKLQTEFKAYFDRSKSAWEQLDSETVKAVRQRDELLKLSPVDVSAVDEAQKKSETLHEKNLQIQVADMLDMEKIAKAHLEFANVQAQRDREAHAKALAEKQRELDAKGKENEDAETTSGSKLDAVEASARDQVDKLTSELQLARTELANQKSQAVSDADAEASKAASALEKFTAERDAALALVKKLEDELAAAQSEIEAAVGSSDNLQKEEADRLKALQQQLQEQKDQADADATKAQAEITRLEELLKTQAAEKAQAAEEAAMDVIAQEAKIKELQDLLADQQDLVATARTDAEKQEEKLKECKAEEEKLKEKTSQQQEELDALQQKLKESQEAKKQAEINVSKAEQDTAEVKEQLAAAQEKADQVDSLQAELTQALKDLEEARSQQTEDEQKTSSRRQARSGQLADRLARVEDESAAAVAYAAASTPTDGKVDVLFGDTNSTADDSKQKKLQVRAEALQATAAKLKKKEQAPKANLLELEKEVFAAEGELLSTQEALCKHREQSLGSRITNLTVRLAALESSNQQNEAELAALRIARDDLTAQLSEANLDLTAVQSQLNQAKLDLAETNKNCFEVLEQRLTQLLSKASTLKNNVEEVQRYADQAKAQTEADSVNGATSAAIPWVAIDANGADKLEQDIKDLKTKSLPAAEAPTASQDLKIVLQFLVLDAETKMQEAEQQVHDAHTQAVEYHVKSLEKQLDNAQNDLQAERDRAGEIELALTQIREEHANCNSTDDGTLAALQARIASHEDLTVKVLTMLLTFCGVTEANQGIKYHELLCLGRGVFGDLGQYPTPDNDDLVNSLFDSLGKDYNNAMHEFIPRETFLGSAVASLFYDRFLLDVGEGVNMDAKSQSIQGFHGKQGMQFVPQAVTARIREAHQMYSIRLTEMRKVFDAIDIDHDQTISSEEMYAFGEFLHGNDDVEWNEERQESLWGDLDRDGDMSCDFDEFCYFYRLVIYDKDDFTFEAGIEHFLDAAAEMQEYESVEQL